MPHIGNMMRYLAVLIIGAVTGFGAQAQQSNERFTDRIRGQQDELRQGRVREALPEVTGPDNSLINSLREGRIEQPDRPGRIGPPAALEPAYRNYLQRDPEARAKNPDRQRDFGREGHRFQIERHQGRVDRLRRAERERELRR